MVEPARTKRTKKKPKKFDDGLDDSSDDVSSIDKPAKKASTKRKSADKNNDSSSKSAKTTTTNTHTSITSKDDFIKNKALFYKYKYNSAKSKVMNVGDVGYKFNKDFNGKSYVGIVVEIRIGAENELDRRCVYADGDGEDLSMTELKSLGSGHNTDRTSTASPMDCELLTRDEDSIINCGENSNKNGAAATNGEAMLKDGGSGTKSTEKRSSSIEQTKKNSSSNVDTVDKGGSNTKVSGGSIMNNGDMSVDMDATITASLELACPPASSKSRGLKARSEWGEEIKNHDRIPRKKKRADLDNSRRIGYDHTVGRSSKTVTPAKSPVHKKSKDGAPSNNNKKRNVTPPIATKPPAKKVKTNDNNATSTTAMTQDSYTNSEEVVNKSSYQIVKEGRISGYPIIVKQVGSEHEAILLGCSTNDNPQDFLNKNINGKVKIRWKFAGYNDHVYADTVRLKEMSVAPPIRKAAVQSIISGGTLKRAEGDHAADEPKPSVATSHSYFESESPTSKGIVHIPLQVTSDMNVKTEGEDTDEEEELEQVTSSSDQAVYGYDTDNDDPKPLEITSDGNIKGEGVETDNEMDPTIKVDTEPQVVTSSHDIKTQGIGNTYECDTDSDEPQPLAATSSMLNIKAEDTVDTDDEIDTQKQEKCNDNLTLTASASPSDQDDAVVLKLFEKLNSCFEEETLTDEIETMIKSNQYLINAKCPQATGHIESGCTVMEALCCLAFRWDVRDLLYELVCMGGKATDICYEKILSVVCYEKILDQYDYRLPLEAITVLLLSGYIPPKKKYFFLDELAEGFDEDEENDYEDGYSEIVKILYKDIRLGDNLSCGDVNKTVINNINGLPPLVIGETHSEGGAMADLLKRFPQYKDLQQNRESNSLASASDVKPDIVVSVNASYEYDTDCDENDPVAGDATDNDVNADGKITDLQQNYLSNSLGSASGDIKPDVVASDAKAFYEYDTDCDENTSIALQSSGKPTDDDVDVDGVITAPIILNFFVKLDYMIDYSAIDFDQMKEMIETDPFLLNAKCPQSMSCIEKGYNAVEVCCQYPRANTRDFLYDVLVKLGAKATDRSYYECWKHKGSVSDFVTVLLLSGYYPISNGSADLSGYYPPGFFLDEMADKLDTDEDEHIEIIRILSKVINLGDNLSCGGVDSTVMNNIKGLPLLDIGVTYSKGGPMDDLLKLYYPLEKVKDLEEDKKVRELKWEREQEEQKKESMKTQKLGLKQAPSSSVSNNAFDAEQPSKKKGKQSSAATLMCSVCKVAKGSVKEFSSNQRKKGVFRKCKDCIAIYLKTCMKRPKMKSALAAELKEMAKAKLRGDAKIRISSALAAELKEMAKAKLRGDAKTFMKSALAAELEEMAKAKLRGDAKCGNTKKHEELIE